jgi:DNA N-6-adenine-methyltransferase (Dam)
LNFWIREKFLFSQTAQKKIDFFVPPAPSARYVLKCQRQVKASSHFRPARIFAFEEADMAEHEPCIGATDDWYTPRDIFDALGLTFDLDPCSPGPTHWVPARKIYTKEDDGLVQPWSGTVFMNPPFGRRNGHVPWLRKFLAHGDGVAIVRAYTSSAWFHQWAVKAQTMCFPRGKTKFIRPDGSIGRAPGHGVVLLGMGAVANKALAQCGLGFFVPIDPCNATVIDGEGTALAQMLRLGNQMVLR